MSSTCLTKNWCSPILGSYQGWYKMTKISNVLSNSIAPDPLVPNYRGPVRDTTKLQPSIQQEGIQDPLWVRVNPEEEKQYFLISGYRRLAAARALGLKRVPVILKEADTPERVMKLMMTANQFEDVPDIVLSGKGEVIGGNTLAAYIQHEAGVKDVEIAEDLGCRPNVAGAYHFLYRDLLAVQRLVASERLAITVYSVFRGQSVEFRQSLVDEVARKSLGKVSARWVRKFMKEFKTPDPYANGQVDSLEDTVVMEQASSEPIEIKQTVIQKLQGALALLRGLDPEEIEVLDMIVLSSILDEVTRIKEGLRE